MAQLLSKPNKILKLKIMKNTKTLNNLIALILIAFVSISTTVSAQQHQPQRNNQRNPPQGLKRAGAISKQPSMVQAQKVLKRTHFVILKAHQAVKKNKNYTGDLARAVAHQKQAKKMFAMKNPHKAILHSKCARMYAFKVLQVNKANTDVDQSYQFNKEETDLAGVEDNSVNLDKELEKTTFDDKTVTDKEMTELEVLETKPENYKNEN